MLDPQLLKGVLERVPTINDRIAEGYARTQLVNVDKTVHDVIRYAARGFPEGLVYEGFERVSPQDTFKYLTTPRSTSYSRSQFDLARTDVFLVKFKFSFKGQSTKPQYLFLPFVDDCSRMHIRNSLFYIKPVLADTLISVDGNSIFVSFTSTSCNFYKTKYTVLRNGIPEYQNVIYAMIHHELANNHRQQKNKAMRLRILSNCHYLFAKFGFEETMLRYHGIKVHIGTDDINIDNYPVKNWAIIEANGTKPEGHPNKFWQCHNIKVAIERDAVNDDVMAAITCMFYVLDLFPDNVTPDWVRDKTFWMKTMGFIVFGNEMGDGDAYSKTAEHLTSVDGYFDAIAIENAKQIGVFVDDMYDFINHIAVKFTDYIQRESKRGANNLYGKRLTVSSYILKDVNSNIFRAINFNKKRSANLTMSDIERMLNKAFKLRQVYDLNKGLQYVSTIMSPADCRIFKITSSVVPQHKTQSKKTEINKAALRDPKRQLDYSMLEIGSVTQLPKSHPIGDAVIAICAKTTANGTLIPNPEYAHLMKEAEKYIVLDY